MLRTSVFPVRAGLEPRLRAWLAELGARAEEVLATFRDEGVRCEQAFVLPGATGPLLVALEAMADPERARAAAASSRHAIDAEHRAILRECLGSRLDVPALHDVTTEGGAPGGPSALHVRFHPVLAGREPLLRASLAALAARAQDVRAALRDEGVRCEQACLVHGAVGPILAWAAEVEATEGARASSSRGPRLAPARHGDALGDCLGPPLDVAPACDLRLS